MFVAGSYETCSTNRSVSPSPNLIQWPLRPTVTDSSCLLNEFQTQILLEQLKKVLVARCLNLSDGWLGCEPVIPKRQSLHRVQKIMFSKRSVTEYTPDVNHKIGTGPSKTRFLTTFSQYRQNTHFPPRKILFTGPFDLIVKVKLSISDCS